MASGFSVTKIEFPCHLRDLFINHEGNLYPCCRKWGDPAFKIGHIDNPDILDLLKNFYRECECEGYKLRRIMPGEAMDVSGINIEFSLACNGKCAMCCVNAPEWRGNYNYYDALTRITDACKPKLIAAQGGEVLFQKKTMNWLTKTKNKYPEMKFHIITNGCFDEGIIPQVEYIFDTLTLSIVGFEPETYKKIMGLDLYITMHFAEELIKRGKVKVSLKFLCTPLNFHQIGIFFDWAIAQKPDSIQMVDASLKSYINIKTPDNFWQKIIQRTMKDLQKRILDKKNLINNENVKIFINKSLRDLFQIDDKFIKDNDLLNFMPWY